MKQRNLGIAGGFWRKGIFLFAVTSVSALVFFGCGPLLPAPKETKSYFVLSDNGSIPQNLPHLQSRLLVRDTDANQFINSRKIIFSDNPETRGYYQLARWVEPPPDRFALLLLQRIEKAGIFAAASRVASSALGDLQLNTEIIEFYHDTSVAPGQVVVRIGAELIDLHKRTVLAQRQFEETVPVQQYDAQGAVAAFSTAVSKILDQIIAWLGDSLRQ